MNGACRVCRGPSKDRRRPVASSEGAPPAGLGTTTATWSNACCPHPVWSSVSEPLTSCRLVQECEADEAAKRVAAGHACKAANQPNETPPDSSTCTPRPKSRRNLGEISARARHASRGRPLAHMRGASRRAAAGRLSGPTRTVRFRSSSLGTAYGRFTSCSELSGPGGSRRGLERRGERCRPGAASLPPPRVPQRRGAARHPPAPAQSPAPPPPPPPRHRRRLLAGLWPAASAWQRARRRRARARAARPLARALGSGAKQPPRASAAVPDRAGCGPSPC